MEGGCTREEYIVWRVGLTGYSTFPIHAQPQLNSIKININSKVMVARVEHIAYRVWIFTFNATPQRYRLHSGVGQWI